MYVVFAHIYVYAPHVFSDLYSIQRGQKRVLDPVELELDSCEPSCGYWQPNLVLCRCSQCL